MADTRKDKRAPVSLKVRFKSATVDEFIEHYCKDVSRGGIFIKSSQPMPVGTLLKFQFQLKDESALIRGVGRVVWTRIEEDAAADKPPGMGIKFIKMDNESRVLVERIVDAHAPEEGTYEIGREQATDAAPISSEPPPLEGGSFFPNLPPAELPPPEDRTAVRQATQSLAAVLTGSSDESAAEEARERAEQARRRSEEIEAQRRRDAEQQAEQRKRRDAEREAEPSEGSLPSMIIDPSLEPRAGRAAEGSSSSDLTPIRSAPSESGLSALREPAQLREPDTEPPAGPEDQPPTSTTSIPPLPDLPRRSYAPIFAITAVLLIAAIVALRGGPRELPVEPMDHEAEAKAGAAQPAANDTPPAPEPAPTAAQARSAGEDEAEHEPPAPSAAPNAAPAATVSLEVASTPRGAEVFVGEERRGTTPLTLALADGVPVRIRAHASGYAEVQQELTPNKKSAPLRFKLKPLPYVVHVDSTPAGASVNVGGHKGTAPVDLKLEAAPGGELAATARLSGYHSAHLRLAPTAFSEQEGAMRASLAFALRSEETAEGAPAEASHEVTADAHGAPREPAKSTVAATAKERPKKVVAARKAPKSEEWEEAPPAPPSAPMPPVAAEPAGEPPAKPAPEPKPAEPPAQAPEPLPDNPFGGE